MFKKYKYPSLISFFKSFTKLEATYMTFVFALAIGMAIFFPELMLESTASPLLLFCSVCNVIANPLVETMNAKQFRGNFIIDIFLIEITYIILSLHLGWYTLMLSCIFFWIPIDIISFIQWSKHIDNEDDNLTVVKRLGWKKSTTYTVLKKLCDRGIFQNREGTVSSLISKEEAQAREIDELVEKKFEGSVPSFIAAFARRRELTNSDLDEMQKIIDSIRSGGSF